MPGSILNLFKKKQPPLDRQNLLDRAFVPSREGSSFPHDTQTGTTSLAVQNFLAQTSEAQQPGTSNNICYDLVSLTPSIREEEPSSQAEPSTSQAASSSQGATLEEQEKKKEFYSLQNHAYTDQQVFNDIKKELYQALGGYDEVVKKAKKMPGFQKDEPIAPEVIAQTLEKMVQKKIHHRKTSPKEADMLDSHWKKFCALRLKAQASQEAFEIARKNREKENPKIAMEKLASDLQIKKKILQRATEKFIDNLGEEARKKIRIIQQAPHAEAFFLAHLRGLAVKEIKSAGLVFEGVGRYAREFLEAKNAYQKARDAYRMAGGELKKDGSDADNIETLWIHAREKEEAIYNIVHQLAQTLRAREEFGIWILEELVRKKLKDNITPGERESFTHFLLILANAKVAYKEAVARYHAAGGKETLKASFGKKEAWEESKEERNQIAYAIASILGQEVIVRIRNKKLDVDDLKKQMAKKLKDQATGKEDKAKLNELWSKFDEAQETLEKAFPAYNNAMAKAGLLTLGSIATIGWKEAGEIHDIGLPKNPLPNDAAKVPVENVTTYMTSSHLYENPPLLPEDKLLLQGEEPGNAQSQASSGKDEAIQRWGIEAEGKEIDIIRIGREIANLLGLAMDDGTALMTDTVEIQVQKALQDEKTNVGMKENLLNHLALLHLVKEDFDKAKEAYKAVSGKEFQGRSAKDIAKNLLPPLQTS